MLLLVAQKPVRVRKAQLELVLAHRVQSVTQIPAPGHLDAVLATDVFKRWVQVAEMARTNAGEYMVKALCVQASTDDAPEAR
jgi:hypothetical protein